MTAATPEAREKARVYRRANKTRINAKNAEWRKQNPEKMLAATKRWQKANPDKHKGHLRRARLKTFGLTEADFDAMWETQNRGCASCGDSCLGRREPVIDHCHATGRVRGLLCLGCNVSLGMMKEDAKRIRALVAYAESC